MILSAGRHNLPTNIVGLQINNDFVFISLILTDKLLLASLNCYKQEIYWRVETETQFTYDRYKICIFFLTDLITVDLRNTNNQILHGVGGDQDSVSNWRAERGEQRGRYNNYSFSLVSHGGGGRAKIIKCLYYYCSPAVSRETALRF